VLISAVLGARTREVPDGCDLVVTDGRVDAVLARGAASAAGAYDAAGRVVLPGLVDAHVHLDKAFLGHEGAQPTLAGALGTVARQRLTTTAARTRELATQALDRLSSNGITAARAHVEIGLDVGLSLLAMHQGLPADGVDLQLVAFPQNGLEQAGMPALLDAAMVAGGHVVGGCPYVDRDPAAHLETVFAVAQRRQAPVDLHLDFGDDASASLLPLVAERTRALGMAGLVTVGHVTTLAAMAPYEQAKALELLAAAGISLVVLPATDVYLMGHGEPGTRSVAPYDRAVAAGVRTAVANNNLGNAFAPFGNGNLLQAAWLGGLLRRDSNGTAGLLDAVTTAPAAILGLPPHGTVVGGIADLAVVRSDRVEDVVLEAPAVEATVKCGRLLPAWSAR
jgi:cytosine deaminase